ncbi:MAG: GTPase HflX [Sphaerochaetaceae bacterium]|nr:GTPase HflX [Sphaerochaetaceae bacterium]
MESVIEIRMGEITALTDTMGLECLSVEIYPVRDISPATYITQGKTEQLRELVEDSEAEIVVFDTFLSPRQQRNLEQILSCAVIDREEVILQIFSDHARTREARLQTDLAYALYSLPRLTRAWTHLSRQRGGAKGTRGEGEKQLEVDRRLVRDRINRIEKELAVVRRQRSVQRKNRLDSSKSLVAVVGYTNAGKSSLLNSLCDSDIHVEDKLFATLEPVTRNIVLPSGRSVLVSDTVGFVQNLPHHLVESFKSTLEEVTFADVLIHVIDASHPDPLACYETTRQVLHDLEITDTPTINVINKIDAIENQFVYQRMKHELADVVEISVKEHLGYETLLSRIEEAVFARSLEMNLLLPYGEGRLLSLLHEQAEILSTEYKENGVALHVAVPRSLVDSCISYAQA